MDNQIIQSTIDLIKLIGVLFALFQFILGLIVAREVAKMNSLIKNRNTGLINFLSFIFTVYLLGVLILFLFI